MAAPTNRYYQPFAHITQKIQTQYLHMHYTRYQDTLFHVGYWVDEMDGGEDEIS